VCGGSLGVGRSRRAGGGLQVWGPGQGLPAARTVDGVGARASGGCLRTGGRPRVGAGAPMVVGDGSPPVTFGVGAAVRVPVYKCEGVCVGRLLRCRNTKSKHADPSISTVLPRLLSCFDQCFLLSQRDLGLLPSTSRGGQDSPTLCVTSVSPACCTPGCCSRVARRAVLGLAALLLVSSFLLVAVNLDGASKRS